MCRLDDEVRSWREDLQGKGWFSPLELNELEDHLRSHAAEERESGPAPGSAAAFEAAVREEIGDPARLFREYARSEAPVWRSVLLTGWGLYALSLLLPGFGIVAFQRASPSFGVSAAGWEFLWLALGNGWIVELLPNLAMAMTLPLLGRTARRRMEGWVGRALGARGRDLRPRIRSNQFPAPASGHGRWRPLHVRTSRSRLLGVGRVVRACAHRSVVARQRVGRHRTEKVVRLASETSGRPDNRTLKS